jgi:membrane fusion protein, multidrug efflux system
MRVSFAVRVLSIVGTLALVACSAGGQATQRQEQAPASRGGRGQSAAAVPVTTAPVEQKAVPLQVNVIGAVEGSSSVSIRAQVTGVLTAVNFREGDDVTKGQVLFTLDRRPLEATLEQVQANLERDLAQAANAKAIAQRFADLAARGIATREQVETSRTSAAALDATVGADRAAVENATVQLQYATIEAPISGRTGVLLVNPGNLVRANDATPMVVINQISPVHVVFAILESQLPTLRSQMAKRSVRVEARPPGDPAPPSIGRITFVDNTVDPTTGTIRFEGEFPNADRRLWPGQFVNVVVTLETDPAAIVVPTLAVQTNQQGLYVFVVKPDQTVDMRPVEVLRTNGEETVVKSGLKPGEIVVTDGQLRLVPGSAVSIRSAEKVAS